MTSKKLFPPQQAVLDHGILDLGFSSVLSLPTGSGKTTLAEMAMERALACGEKVAYLTPLKALAEEKIPIWSDRWKEIKVGIFTGDYTSSSTPIPYREAQILICTYEKLDAILRNWQRHFGWLAELGLAVVDEFHLLTDASRGPRLEGTISGEHGIGIIKRDFVSRELTEYEIGLMHKIKLQFDPNNILNPNSGLP